MLSKRWRFSLVLLGLGLVAGVIPAAQAGSSARLGASSAVTAARGDGVVNYSVRLDASDIETRCVKRRRGRCVSKESFASFEARIPEQKDRGESRDQFKCRFDRRVSLYEKTRTGRDKISSASTGNDGSANFGEVEGVHNGDTYFAVVAESTTEDRYGDLITCAEDSSNEVTL